MTNYSNSNIIYSRRPIVNNNKECDFSGLKSMTIRGVSTMQRRESASMLHYTYISRLVRLCNCFYNRTER